MDHPEPFSDSYAWRTTAIVAAAIAALELVLLVVLAVALVAKPLLDGGDAKADVAKRQPAKQARAGAAPKLSRAETSVLVLNGNGRPGAAGETADLVRTRRYVVAGTANAPRTDFARSIVMFRPGYRGEADRLARDFRIPRVAPLDGLRPADLQGAHVAIIVGGD